MEENKARKINTIIVLSLGGLILIWVGLRIIFPFFVYDSAKPEKVDRTRIFVIDRKINEKRYLTVAPLFDYPYHSIKLVLKDQTGLLGEGNKIKIEKGFVVQAYPEGEMISNKELLKKLLFENNQTELHNGSLVSYNNTVFFVSRGKTRAFIASEVFKKLGFDWDNVIAIDGTQYAELGEGEIIDFNSPHPDGTILKIDNSLFLIWEGQKRQLAESNSLSEIWGKYHAVNFKSSDPKLVDECLVKKNLRKDLVCEINPEEHHLEGDSYLFDISDEKGTIKLASVKFSTLGSLDFSVVKDSLTRIKNALHARYGESI